MLRPLPVVAAIIAGASGQKIGHLKQEKHPQLEVSLTCTKAGGCPKTTQGVVVDGNWRWMHKQGNTTNCYTGNLWDPTLCPDPDTCKQNCVLEGADENNKVVDLSNESPRIDALTLTVSFNPTCLPPPQLPVSEGRLQPARVHRFVDDLMCGSPELP